MPTPKGKKKADVTVSVKAAGEITVLGLGSECQTIQDVVIRATGPDARSVTLRMMD
jgi:hypothetical protein